MPSNILPQLRHLLSDLLPTEPVEATTSLFASGLLDSIALLEVVSLIEGHWSIRFGWTEVNLDNLDSLGKMASFVERKLER